MVRHRLAALAADPGAPIGMRLTAAEDWDRAVHPDPALVAMLEPRGPLAQHSELSGVLHRDLRESLGSCDCTERMFAIA